MKKAKPAFRARRKGKKYSEQEVLDALRKKYGIEPWETVKLKVMRNALVATSGDRVFAAALLGIGLTSLYRHCPLGEGENPAARRLKPVATAASTRN